MRRPEVSVIIPTRDRPDALERTLASVAHQSLPAEKFEIVVVDDGSNPPVSRPVLREGIALRVVRRDGIERSMARNAGAQTAVGTILVFLDDDVTVDEGFLAAHLAAQMEWPGVLAVGRIVLPEEEDDRPFLRFRRALERVEVPVDRGLVAKDNFCTAQNMSIRRESFLALGGFSEEIISGEDQDLALRHSGAGGRIVYLPEATGVHRDHCLDIESYCRRVEWGSEHVVRFCQRHPTWRDNVERELTNGRVRWSDTKLPDVTKRLLKVPLSTRGPLVLAFAMARMLEKALPGSSVLDSLYRGLVGLHAFRGYQRGIRRFGPVAPAPVPPVKRA